MARFTFPWPGRRLSLNINGIYIVLALLIVVAIFSIIFVLNTLSGKEEVTAEIIPGPG